MDGKLEIERTIPYRDKKIIIYKDGRASFADVIFRDEKEAKFWADLVIQASKEKDNPCDNKE